MADLTYPTPEELAHWREVASKATPGPWGCKESGDVLWWIGPDTTHLNLVATTSQKNDEANADFIATFNPALVLRLLALAEQIAQRPPASELSKKWRSQATRAREWERQLLTKLPEDEAAAFSAIAESFRSMAVDFIAAAGICDEQQNKLSRYEQLLAPMQPAIDSLYEQIWQKNREIARLDRARVESNDEFGSVINNLKADNAKLRALITKYLGMSNAAIDAALQEPTGEKS